MKSILITGCNRGLGLGLVRQLVKEPTPPTNLIATCRDVQKAEELRVIAADHKNVHILQLDLKDFDRYGQFFKSVSEIVGEDGLNVLFNNAGVSPKSTRLNFVKVEQLTETLMANTIAPIMLTKELLPLLKRASKAKQSFALGVQRAAVINMSSMLGSIDLNSTGGLYPYRCSKAALNIATKSMSVDLQKDGILTACIHPGWVQTTMGGKNAPMTVEDSTANIIKFLSNLDVKHNGGFYQFNGDSLPW